MDQVEVIDVGLLYTGEMIIQIEKVYGLDKAAIWLAGFSSGLTSMLNAVDEETRRKALEVIDKVAMYCGLNEEQRAEIMRNLPPPGGEGDGRN